MKTLVLAVAVVALVACDRSGGSAAIVVGPDGAPIPSANASLHCPAPNKTRDATTDATGRYQIFAIAMEGSDCVLTITKAGYVTKVVPVTETCREPGGSASVCPTPPRITLVPEH